MVSGKLIRYGLRVARSDFQIFLGKRLKRCFNPPYTVTFSVTDRCDARCSTCTRWENEVDQNELSIDEWEKVLREFGEWINPCYVAYTGGEPFVKEGVLSLLRTAHYLGAYSSICTNGMACDRSFCDELIDAGAEFLLFSLNSIDPQIHNQYKGVEGLHEKIVQAIQYIHGKKSATRAGVTCIITKDNYRILSDFTVWVHGLGASSINFQAIRDPFGPNFSPAPSLSASKGNPLWKVDDLERLDAQLEKVIQQKRRRIPIVTPVQELRALKKYYRNPEQLPRRKGCGIGFRNFIISATGDVKLCYAFPVVGNVRTSCVRDIWFSEKAHQQRMAMLACRYPCVIACQRDYRFSDHLSNFFTRI